MVFEELKRNGGGGGTPTDYNDLTNKPSINNQVLTGNKSLTDLGAATPSDITEAFAPSGITITAGVLKDCTVLKCKSEGYGTAAVAVKESDTTNTVKDTVKDENNKDKIT